MFLFLGRRLQIYRLYLHFSLDALHEKCYTDAEGRSNNQRCFLQYERGRLSVKPEICPAYSSGHFGREENMNQELLERLSRISPEEKGILAGDGRVQKSLYTSDNEFIVDSRQMLDAGKLIDIRPHTRFVHFPRHRHNYIEIIYMCSGTTTHIINESTRLILETGDLLFLNQQATQEILPAGEGDIAVNFIVLPEFFDRTFLMMDERSFLRDFLVGSLKGSSNGEQGKNLADYLHFHVSGILPVQNLVENLIWSLINSEPNRRNINQTTMGLLFLQLMNHTDKINRDDPGSQEQNLALAAMKYIEENYQTATLEELSARLGEPAYYLSRLLRRLCGQTFKNLLQTKRLNQSAFLLTTTSIPVEEIIAAVGYDNTSYFHRIFKEQFGMTPRAYRLSHS